MDNIFWENVKKFFGLLFLLSIYLIVIKLLVFNKQDILKAIIWVECMPKLGKGRCEDKAKSHNIIFTKGDKQSISHMNS